jgi:uncharacterized DUF497 family protein
MDVDIRHLLSYHKFMTRKYNFNFSLEKNRKLIKERNISFEEIISAIESDCIIDVIEHTNLQKYNNQKMYIVKFNDYIYLIPFVIENDGTIFLKTIFSSRKATQKYLKKDKSDEKK